MIIFSLCPLDMILFLWTLYFPQEKSKIPYQNNDTADYLIIAVPSLLLSLFQRRNPWGGKEERLPVVGVWLKGAWWALKRGRLFLQGVPRKQSARSSRLDIFIFWVGVCIRHPCSHHRMLHIEAAGVHLQSWEVVCTHERTSTRPHSAWGQSVCMRLDLVPSIAQRNVESSWL